MANVVKWSKVLVDVQSGLGTPNTITSISVAATGLVTYSGSDPTNGDYVLMTVQGMHQVNGRVFKVANVNTGANTFEIESTTGYDAFTSGSFEVITFGTSMQTATGLTAAGGDFDFLDVTTIHENVRKQVPGAASAASYTFESLWDPADAGLVAMKTASDAQAQRAVRFTFSGGQKVVFNGYVGATLLPTGSAQDVVKTSVTVTMFGRPTIYSS